MEEREDGKTGPKGFTQTLNFIPFFAQHPKCCRHWRSKKQLENDQNPTEIQVSRALSDPLVIPNLIRESQIYSLAFSTWSFLIHFSSWKSEGWSQAAMRRHQIREEKSYLDDKKLPKSWFDTGRELCYWGFFFGLCFPDSRLGFFWWNQGKMWGTQSSGICSNVPLHWWNFK